MSSINECHFYTQNPIGYVDNQGLHVQHCTILNGVYALAWDKIMENEELIGLLSEMANAQICNDYVSVRDRG